MNHEIRIFGKEPPEDDAMEAIILYKESTIELIAGSNNIRKWSYRDNPPFNPNYKKDHTIDDLEDIFSHEAIHHVVLSITGSTEIASKIDWLKDVKKMGLVLDKEGEIS